jgi:hypothetical protein
MQPKWNELYIIPYLSSNGEWSIPDDVMGILFEKMQQEGTDKIVFFDGTINSISSFLKMCKDAQVAMHLVVEEGMKPIAIGWYHHIAEKMAQIHWTTFSASTKEQRHEAGMKSIEYWMKLTPMNVLLAIFPEENKKIKRYAESVGLQIVGSVPSMLWNGYEQRWMDAVISYKGRN